jgi:hypothetical protein
MRTISLARAVKFLRDTADGPGTLQQKMAFLREKGLSDTEILEAINEASGGEAVQTAIKDEPDLAH